MTRLLRQWTEQTTYDAVLVSASSLVPYLQLGELKGIRALVDLVDVDSQKWLDYAADERGPRAWLYRTEGHRLRKLEQDLPSWTGGVMLVSEAEADLYRQFAASGPILAIGNGVDFGYFQPQVGPVEESSCVFVGALDYRPNVDGACWFCEAVWPEIRRARPEAQFYLVGRRPVPAVRQLGQIPGVQVVGQVPDVRPYLARAAVAVVPLRIARGLQNKVLEALAMAKATIASPQVLKGLHVESGVHLVGASSAEEWVAAILQLFDNPTRRQELGAAGRRFVEANHRWDRCLEPLAPLLGLEELTRSPASAAESAEG
jgi:sugar transferase (PEP-CTERM/EpsH1 system associated)